MAVQIPTFRVPFQFTAGVVDVIEQDSQQDIDQRVDAVLRTPLGARPELPEFGIPDTRFSHGRDSAQQIRAAIARWVPSAVTTVEQDDSALLDRADSVTVISQEAARGE